MLTRTTAGASQPTQDGGEQEGEGKQSCSRVPRQPAARGPPAHEEGKTEVGVSTASHPTWNPSTPGPRGTIMSLRQNHVLKD